MDLESVRKSYARYAPVYDLTFRWLLGRKGWSMAADVANQHTGPVLEVGVGTGLALPHYRQDHEVVGIDISPEMLNRARERVSKLRLTQVQQLTLMDASELEFADNSFEVVVAAYVMSVVPDPQRVINEIERVCKPGGCVVIVNHFAAEKGLRSSVERCLAPLSNMLGWRPDFPLEEILARTGLSVVGTHSLAPFGLFTLLQLQKE